jgi:hypothetical protein
MPRVIRFTVRVSEAEAGELLAGRPPGMSLRAHFLLQKRLLALMAREVVRLERERGPRALTFLGLVARRVAEPERDLLPETDS